MNEKKYSMSDIEGSVSYWIATRINGASSSMVSGRNENTDIIKKLDLEFNEVIKKIKK